MNIPGTPEHYQIDRKVPIALIATILIQTVGLAWFGGAAFQRINGNEGNIQKLEQRLDEVQRDGRNTAAFAARLANIETALAEVKADIRAIRQSVRP